jgi:uncharacterized protein YodC (DUF2158 family)
MEKFKKGDVVRLKSGGPDMTVQDLNESEVTCVWFMGEVKQQDDFDVDTLELVPRQKPLPNTFTKRPRRNQYSL